MALLFFSEEDTVSAVNENHTARPESDGTWGEPQVDSDGHDQPCDVTLEAEERTPEEDGYGYGV
jgi:hypothetical protein